VDVVTQALPLLFEGKTEVGAAVEVNMGDKWRPGRIVSTKVKKDKPTKYKVKFDQHPQVRAAVCRVINVAKQQSIASERQGPAKSLPLI